jgi:hypothetical protein
VLPSLKCQAFRLMGAGLMVSGGIGEITLNVRAPENCPVLTAFAVISGPSPTPSVVVQVLPMARTVCLGELLS